MHVLKSTLDLRVSITRFAEFCKSIEGEDFVTHAMSRHECYRAYFSKEKKYLMKACVRLIFHTGVSFRLGRPPGVLVLKEKIR